MKTSVAVPVSELEAGASIRTPTHYPISLLEERLALLILHAPCFPFPSIPTPTAAPSIPTPTHAPSARGRLGAGGSGFGTGFEERAERWGVVDDHHCGVAGWWWRGTSGGVRWVREWDVDGDYDDDVRWNSEDTTETRHCVIDLLR